MSAFLVSTTHIDAMLSGALVLSSPYAPFRWHPIVNGERKTHDLASMIDPEDRDCDPISDYFRELPGYPDPVVVLKAVTCYEYQACETPEWEDSEAFAFCQSLKDTCFRRLPGYEDAPWAIDDRQVFTVSNPSRVRIV